MLRRERLNVSASVKGKEARVWPNFGVGNFYCLIIGLVFTLIGILFKLSVAPFHYWAVDVYEGVPSFLTLFFLVLPKLGFFSILIKICFISFCLVSMRFGLHSGSVTAGVLRGAKARFQLFGDVSYCIACSC